MIDKVHLKCKDFDILLEHDLTSGITTLINDYISAELISKFSFHCKETNLRIMSSYNVQIESDGIYLMGRGDGMPNVHSKKQTLAQFIRYKRTLEALKKQYKTNRSYLPDWW